MSAVKGKDMRIRKILIASLLLLPSSSAFPQQGSPGYSITIAAESQHVKSTNDVAINIEIKNISKATINCQRGTVSGALDVAFQYSVRSASGRDIPRNVDPHPEIGSSTGGWPCVLQPEETARSRAAVGRFYDMQLPGKYLIQISQNDPSSGQVVKSNQIEVTVDPADTPPSITLTISGPQTIPAGKKIEIDAIHTNVTKDTITFWWGYPYTLQIHDEHGKVPPLKPGFGVSGGSTGPRTIKPGETFTEPVGGLLNKYDLSVPGVYVVRVTYRLIIVEGDIPLQHVVQNSVEESNEITIKVVAKESDTP
jgi:hypothetical protein